MPPAKGKRGKAFVKKVQAIVRDEIQEESENKVAVLGLTDTPINTAQIPHGDVSASTNFVKLMPLIQQGLGQYNNRVGNEIRLKSLDIKMLLNYDTTSITAGTNSSVGVRVMILRQKDQNSQTGLISDFQGDKLMEHGAVTNPGPASFTGATWNLVQKVNREQFSVRYDKVFYLDVPYRHTSGSTGIQFPPKTKVMNHTLRFGKQGLKLTFGNAASESPTNFPYVMVLGYASTITSSTPSNNIINYSYSANANYTDA